ncbi:copper-binding protein [Kibdelosporangium aridum]|uniref:Copper-binding protein n=1 Tax=Kibdelosporangium aridum TaxID=2030 RepID=A0A428ZQT6_KIBAR|nr:cupredoxin family copper-binding protein [Kibdelosporangium aridum]RSM90428.1 copper-binding protein [Kibdelosporangium aridum]
MDKPDPPGERTTYRGRLLGALAVVAIAGSLFALFTLAAPVRTDPAPAQVGLAAQNDALAVPELPALAAPLQAAPVQAAAPAAAQPAATKTVEIMGYKYTPAELTIAVGDTVTWTNHDSAPHNVVVTDGPEKFTSPLLQQGQTYTYTFSKAGTYSYFCSVHPDMTAKVTVTGGSTPPPTTQPPTSPPTTPPPTTTPPAKCVPKAALEPFIAHVRAAHLQTSPLTQVTETLNTDQYIKTHTVMLDQMLVPIVDGTTSKAVTDALNPLITHIRAAHLQTSLFTQLTELLNADQYIKTHTVMLDQVLTPLLSQAAC